MDKSKAESGITGWFICDKPEGITSRDLVNQLQKLLGKSAKLGHTGTLDPFATGVLVLGAGSALRLTEYVQEMSKSYTAQLYLGATSSTDDREGEISTSEAKILPDRQMLEVQLQKLIGWIEQIPPQFSAIRVAGKRAHHLARQGETVALAPRLVRVDHINLLAYNPPFLDLQIDCGKGTYIRSLARDLGQLAGCGAYVQQLRRTGIGPFTEKEAIRWFPEPTREILEKERKPLRMALTNMTQYRFNQSDIKKIRFGQRVVKPRDLTLSESSQNSLEKNEKIKIAIMDENGCFHGIGSLGEDQQIYPEKVFPANIDN